MNRINIYVLSSIIVSFLVLLILGCGDRSGNETATSSEQQSAKYKDSSDGAMQDNDGMLEIVDIAGRTVTVPTGDVKVILGASFMIRAIAPLFGKNGNPFTHIVGWKNDIEKYDPDTYEMYLEKFPEIASIPDLGDLHKGDFNIEKVISLNADIVFIILRFFPRVQEIGLIEKLDKVGVKTVVLDVGKYPTRYITPTMLLLGQIFEKTAEASAFVNFSFAQMQKAYSVIDKIKVDEKPLVFMESAANAGFGKVGEYRTVGSHYLGRFIELAGGRNYGSKVFGAKYSAIISTEQLFVIDPDVIIGTGGNWSKAKPTTGAVLLGYKAKKKDTQERLQKIATRTGWETLKAVKNKRVHTIWHQFYNSPYHFIAIQQMAKWFYPKKFADLDPEKTFIELHDRFLPISYSGQFWISLE